MSITRVQYAHGNANGTSLTVSFTAAAAGDLLVALVATGSTSSNGTCSTPTGWTLGVGPITNSSASPSPINYYLFWKIAAGGETSITVTDSVSSGITCQVWEASASAGWPASPLDVSASSANQAATTSPVTGTTATTSQAEELWIAGVCCNFSTQVTFSAPLNGFTQEASEWGGSSAFFAPNSDALYKIVSATGTASSGGTSSASRAYAGIIAAFKDNTGGGGTVSSGVVDMGGSGGLTAKSFALASTVDAGENGGGIVHFALLGENGGGIVHFVLLGGNGGGIVHFVLLGNTDGGFTAQSIALSGVVDVGGGGGLLAQSIAIGTTTEGNNGGGLTAIVPTPTNLGTNGGGIVPTASVIISSGVVRLGGFALIWNSSQAGIPPFYGVIGEPNGRWVYVTCWIWRASAGPGWTLMKVKRWKQGTLSWHQL